MEEKPGPTFELWLLALSLLAVSLSGWLRLYFALNAWSLLQEIGINPGPLYQAAAGGSWGLAALACALGLVLGLRWAPAATRVVVLALNAWYWLDFLLLSRSSDAIVNWPYMLVISLAWILFTFAVLALDRQKRYFSH